MNLLLKAHANVRPARIRCTAQMCLYVCVSAQHRCSCREAEVMVGKARVLSCLLTSVREQNLLGQKSNDTLMG